MEVSSHALVEGRVHGCDYDIAVFTNLTQDHLDYHKTMDEYTRAKGLLFSQLGNTFHDHKPKFAVLNADDPASEYIEHQQQHRLLHTELIMKPIFKLQIFKMTSNGTSFRFS